MGKLKVFDIEFSNANGVYYAGQTVSGNVILVLDDDMEAAVVRLKAIGRANTSWTDSRSSASGIAQLATFTAEEVYFEKEIELFGRWREEATMEDLPTLTAGRKELPFTFELPKTCPTSFEGDFGHIRYVCRAIIDRPWDHVTKKAFSVIYVRDLNSEEGAAETSVDSEASELVKAHCWKSGEVHAKANLPRASFVPGERLPIWVHITNSSGRTIRTARAKLIQRSRYKGRFRTSQKERTSYRKVADVTTKEPLPSNWALIWNRASIHIPPLPPEIHNCSIVSVDYGLIFEIAKITLTLEVSLGSVPLRHTFARLRSQYQLDWTLVDPTDADRFPIDLLPLPPPFDNYPGMPPPCYSSDCFGEVNIRERGDGEFMHGILEFAPRYPYYSWPPDSWKIDCGSVLLTVSYSPNTNKFSITVVRAHKLRAMDITGASDPYVKMMQFHNKKMVRTKKTTIKRANLNPEFDETLTFDVVHTAIDSTTFVIQVMDWDRIGSDDLIGCCILGAGSKTVEGREQWRQCFGTSQSRVARISQSRSSSMWHSLIPEIPEGFAHLVR